ncbi:MAG: hypothetical protein U9Q07_07445, partial [Planctomycetota bacterium]|nr:hypothetical protein [Planctomycetota bacterium]
TISGSTQIASVTLKGFPGVRPVVSGPGGAYTTTVPHDWSGKITPEKAGYEFQPASLPIDRIMAPMSNQDFMHTLLQRKISGTVRSSKNQPVADVAIVTDNNGGQTITDASGQYELLVDHGWGGKISPVKEGYTFSPTNKPYSRVIGDMSNQVFTATQKMFSVSGAVVLGGVPIDGVLITASDGSGSPISATTDMQGKYTLQVPFGWTGEISPTKEGIMFDPPSQSLIDVRTNIVNGQAVAPTAPPVSVIPPTPQPSTPAVVPPGTPPATVVPSGTPPATVVAPGTPPATVVPPGTPPAAVQPETDMERQIRELQEKLAAITGTPGAARPSAITTMPPQDPGNAFITNSWLEGDLVLEVLPDIANEAGIMITPDDVVAATPVYVTANLRNIPLDQALDIVLGGTSFVVKKTPNYYLVASAGLADPKFAAIAETRRVRLSYITAEAALGLLATAFKPYVQSELPVVETDGSELTARRMSQTYTLLVTAPPALMERILADLKLVDKAPAQVLLKARIVAMARTDLLNLGVEWGWPTMQAGFFSGNNYGRGDLANDFGGKSPWGVQMGYTPDLTFTNSLQMALNLLTVNGEATILSKPQVVAQDGKQATMKVVNEEYFFLSANQTNTSQFQFQSSQLETIESGTTLTITPHIGQNNDITLQVSIEVSDSIPRGRDSELPVVTRRMSDSTVVIMDGGTVALAGLTQEKSITTHKRTPGLSNLPLIGGLFNNADDQTESQEIAVFITAHIMRHSSQQAAGVPQALEQNSARPMSPTFSPPPVDQRYGRAPVDQRFDRAPVDQRFDRAPVDQRFDRAPVDQRFDRAPIEPRFDPAPVDQRFNPPYRGPASSRSRQGSFQDELRDSLSDNQRR